MTERSPDHLHSNSPERTPQLVTFMSLSEMRRNALDHRKLMSVITALDPKKPLVEALEDELGNLTIFLTHSQPLDPKTTTPIPEELLFASVDDIYVPPQHRGRGVRLGMYSEAIRSVGNLYHVPIVTQSHELTSQPGEDEELIEGPNEYGGYQFLLSLARRGLVHAVCSPNSERQHDSIPHGFISIPPSLNVSKEVLTLLENYYWLAIRSTPSVADIQQLQQLRKKLFSRV